MTIREEIGTEVVDAAQRLEEQMVMRKGVGSFRTKKAGSFLLPGIGNLVLTNYGTRYGRNQIPREGSGFGIR